VSQDQNVINLKEFKVNKRSKKIVKDLEVVITLINKYEKELSQHSQFIPVKDILMTLKNNKWLLENYFLKFKKLLDDKKDGS